MTILPLDQLGLNFRSSYSALWWISLLYRKPKYFSKTLNNQKRTKQLKILIIIIVHVIPQAFLITFAGDSILSIPLGREVSIGDNLIIVVMGLLFGAMFGSGGVIIDAIAFALAINTTSIFTNSVIYFAGSIIAGLISGIIFAFGSSNALEFGDNILSLTTMGFGFGIAMHIGFGVLPNRVDEISVDFSIGKAKLRVDMVIGYEFMFILASAICTIYTAYLYSIPSSLVILLSAIFSFFRIYYLPIHFYFLSLPINGAHYIWHPIAWDDLCLVPFPGLERLLVSYAESDEHGEAEIQRLVSSYPSQRTSALKAQVILIAREAASMHDLASVSAGLSGLPEGDSGFLLQTKIVRSWVSSISAQQLTLDAERNPQFRAILARQLVTEIEAFQKRLGGLRQPLAHEFQNAAKCWLQLAGQQLVVSEWQLDHLPIPQVFRDGDPVIRKREAFILRRQVMEELQQQLLLAASCPGLLLYARRRMGKSTLLKNIQGFLPSNTICVYYDMQNAEAFTNDQYLVDFFLTHASEATDIVLPDELLEPLPRLSQGLSILNEHLENTGRWLVMGVDEYEKIDEKLGMRVLSEDLLSVLRHSIQSHRHIVWLFAGSHRLQELRYTTWPSYLISLRTVHVPVFSKSETRELLTNPLQYSDHLGKDDPNRVHFDPTVWGDNGVDMIHKESGGWPVFVQALAAVIIDMFNQADQRALTDELFERAADKVVIRNDLVFTQILDLQTNDPYSEIGDAAYLAGFKTSETQIAPADLSVRQSLKRRELIIDDGETWRLSVPLMRRWLKQNC